MNFTQPSLTLYFYTSSTPETVIVSDAYLVKESFSFQYQLLNGLNPSSNKVSFKLKKDCSAIAKILSYQVDTKAVLSDSSTTLFTGYLSDNYTWKINTNGEQEFEVTIEDVGTKLLGKAFLTSSAPSLYNLSGLVYSGNNSILAQICSRAGISIAANQDAITTEICANIDKNATCKDLLSQILLEAGYTYYFNNLGALCLYKIDCTSVSGIPVINKDSLYTVSKNALTLTKKVKQYKQVNVSYDEYETRTGVLVYKDISGQDSSHPDCNITIKANSYYPVMLYEVSTVALMLALTTSDVDLENYVRVTATDKVYQVVTLGTSGADYDGDEYSFIETSVNETSYVEAEDLDKGKEIISISNVTGDVTYSGSLSYTISQRGAKNIAVVLHNTSGSSNTTVTKLQATATITNVKANCIVIAGDGTSTDAESENIYSTEAKYIHTKAYVTTYANMIVDYYKYCNYTYQFYCSTDYTLGTLVNVVDNLFSGLTVNLMLTAKSYTDKSSIIKYTAVAISPFNLSAGITHEQTLANDSSGVQGLDGVGIESIIDWYATSATQTGAKTTYSRTLPTLNPTTAKYLWIKRITTYTDGTTSETESIGAVYGNTGEAGTDADVVDINIDSHTYLENKRLLTGTNTIEAAIDLQGTYTSGTLSVKDDSGTGLAYITEKNGTAVTATSSVSVVDGDFVKISIPYTDDFNVNVILVSSSKTITKTITPIDGTIYGYNYGLQTTAPTGSSVPVPIYVSGKETDYYTNSTDGITYEYNGSGWVACDDAQRLTQGLKLLLDAGTDLSTISNANTVSFFKTIISQTIYTNAIKAVQGFFDSITVTGDSVFNGTIKSSAFTTTLQNSTPASTTQMTLESTAYWNWNTFKSTLTSNYTSGAYTSVSGTYSTIRVGTSRISLPYGQETSGFTVVTNNNKSRSTNAFPRTQNVCLVSEVSTGSVAVVQIYVNGTSVGYISGGNGSLTVSVPAGGVITATGASSSSTWAAWISYYDVPSDFPEVCFFDSSGTVHTYSGYNTGTLTVDSYSPSANLYKWGGMSSSSGGGDTTSGSVVSAVNEDGSVSFSSKQVAYASWTNASQLRLVFSDGTGALIDASDYFTSMSGSFSLMTASDSVVAATITPKASTNTVGAAGNPFNEGHFNALYGDLTGDVTGNVNSSGTSYKVYGAVFN